MLRATAKFIYGITFFIFFVWFFAISFQHGFETYLFFIPPSETKDSICLFLAAGPSFYLASKIAEATDNYFWNLFDNR